jgi:hypothetical protein
VRWSDSGVVEVRVGNAVILLNILVFRLALTALELWPQRQRINRKLALGEAAGLTKAKAALTTMVPFANGTL